MGGYRILKTRGENSIFITNVEIAINRLFPQLGLHLQNCSLFIVIYQFYIGSGNVKIQKCVEILLHLLYFFARLLQKCWDNKWLCERAILALKRTFYNILIWSLLNECLRSAAQSRVSQFFQHIYGFSHNLQLKAETLMLLRNLNASKCRYKADYENYYTLYDRNFHYNWQNTRNPQYKNDAYPKAITK